MIHLMGVDWKFTSMDIGEQCVMTPGAIMMPEWPVDSWDILE